MDWSRGEISDLINLYRQYECLWNTTNNNYNNFDIKRNAWLDISCACGKDLGDIKRKVKNLRSAYVLEKKKSEASKERNISYIPNLFYYKDMDFLDSVVVLRKRSPVSSASTFNLSSQNSNRELKHKIVKLDRKSLRDTKFNNAIDTILASVQQSHTKATSVDDVDGNDVFSSFGKTTALQLQQLPFDKATEAMAAIYQLVAKKTLDSLKKSQNKRNNGVASSETMSS